MCFIAKYVFGSPDSQDRDVCFLVEKLPPFQECKEFCYANSRRTGENTNIAEYDPEKRIIRECFIGIPDELNNSIIHTYPMHKQEYPLLLVPVPRIKMLKVVRATRITLTMLTRTRHRTAVKQALRSNSLTKRLHVLSEIDLTEIKEFNKKKLPDVEVLKKIAFQIGQTILLLHDHEVYTKGEISVMLPELRPYLYRQKTSRDALQEYLEFLLESIPLYKEKNGCVVCEEGMIDIKKERVIKGAKCLGGGVLL